MRNTLRDLIRRLAARRHVVARGRPRQVICAECGAEFTGYKKTSRCCSQLCRNRYERKLRKADPLRALRAESRSAASRRRSTGSVLRRYRSSRARQAIIAEAMAAFSSDPRYVQKMAKEARLLEARRAAAARARAGRAARAAQNGKAEGDQQFSRLSEAIIWPGSINA